jgi:hypothetical protein
MTEKPWKTNHEGGTVEGESIKGKVRRGIKNNSGRRIGEEEPWIMGLRQEPAVYKPVQKQRTVAIFITI